MSEKWMIPINYTGADHKLDLEQRRERRMKNKLTRKRRATRHHGKHGVPHLGRGGR